MKTNYCPTGINNFHNSAPISLIVSGDKATGITCDGDVYRISTGQAKRIEKHFCGVAGCRCAAGAVQQLNEAGTEWGIRVDWCESF